MEYLEKKETGGESETSQQGTDVERPDLLSRQRYVIIADEHIVLEEVNVAAVHPEKFVLSSPLALNRECWFELMAFKLGFGFVLVDSQGLGGGQIHH